MIAGIFAPLAMKISGGVIVVLLIAAVWFWIGWSADDKRADQLAVEVRVAEAAIAVLRTDANLKEVAAIQRQADNTSVAATEKELSDAIEDVLDSAPDAVSLRLGCERLRRAGTPAADLPAVCGSGG